MPPLSNAFDVQLIPNAGRGVVATRPIANGAVVFESGPPAFHVVFSHYRKETCAQCFFWDRGRTLPERVNELGKVFCTPQCRSSWFEEQSALALDMSKALVQFTREKHKVVVTDILHVGPRPTREQIAMRWREAKKQAALIKGAHGGQGVVARKTARATLRKVTSSIHPDLLSYFLSGLLYNQRQPTGWQDEVLELAMDDEPYRSENELDAHCDTMVQLAALFPPDHASENLAGICQTMVQADNHNAFGLNSGTSEEDKEEYMGYAVYPSSSYFNHSCCPNLAKVREGRSWKFTAIRDIPVGEEMCITYLGGAEKDLGVVQRMARLSEVWGFQCSCRRCIEDDVSHRDI